MSYPSLVLDDQGKAQTVKFLHVCSVLNPTVYEPGIPAPRCDTQTMSFTLFDCIAR
jgi:hypothetical protein